MTKPRYLTTIKEKGFWFIEGKTVYFLPWLYGTVFGNMFGRPIKIAKLRKGEIGVIQK